MERRPPASVRRGAAAGLPAGLATIALMYFAADLAGIQPLPELLQQPLLAVMPGPLFGLLIDTLQHAGKVVEEIGLIAAMAAGFAALGAVHEWLRDRVPLSASVAAALGWLVITLALLPVSGQGLLGLSGGLAQPLVWAVLMLVFSVLLQWLDGVLARPSMTGEAEPERRRFLWTVPAAVGAAGVAVLGWKLGPGWYLSVFKPAEAGLSGISDEVTPPDHFYYVSKNFQDPDLDVGAWRLQVGGLASSPMTLDFAALQALPAVEQYVTLECISNTVGGNLISTAQWRGVPLRELLAQAGPKPSATAVNFTAADGYTETLPLPLVQSSPEILLAYLLDGRPLSAAHGKPARILIPGHYGMKGPKWLTSIQLAEQAQGGYWEGQGWDASAVVKTMSRIDTPTDGDVVPLGAVLIGGVAFAGTRGISDVQISTDGGATWRSADLRPPLSKRTWVIWQTMWQPSQEGSYQLVVRARDGQGQLQPNGGNVSYPSGAAGYHAIRVNVGRS